MSSPAAYPNIACDLLFGQRRGRIVVNAIHDVSELVQEREGQNERYQVEGGFVLIVAQAVTIIGRRRDVRWPTNVARLLGSDKRLSAGDTLLEVKFVLPAGVIDVECLVEWHPG